MLLDPSTSPTDHLPGPGPFAAEVRVLEHNQAQGANRQDAGSGSHPSPGPVPGESPTPASPRGAGVPFLAAALMSLSFVLLGAVRQGDVEFFDARGMIWLAVVAIALAAWGLGVGVLLIAARFNLRGEE